MVSRYQFYLKRLAGVVYCNTITGILMLNAYEPRIYNGTAFEVLTQSLMDAKNSMNEQNKGLGMPISNTRKRKTKIVPVTLRLPKWWLKRVKERARELSIRYHQDISHCDLIRDVVYSTFVRYPTRTAFPTSCRMCQRRMNFEENVKLFDLCV